MAVGLDVVEKNLEDLEREITCAVCQEHYTDPKILPCLHCYCKQCIHRLALRVGQGKPFPCPECRKNTVLPEGGEGELKSAFILNRLKSMYLKHKKALSKQVSCEICTNANAIAEAFCRQCNKFACKNCVHMHSVMTGLFNGHECVPVEQLQNIESEKFVPKHPEPKKCTIHGDHLKIFCFDCKILICRDCTVKDHRDHNIEFNNVAADNKKKELVEALQPLKKVEQSLTKTLTMISKVEREIQEQEKTATNRIEASFEELHSVLELHKEKLLGEVKGQTEDKIEKLAVQKKQLSTTSEEVRSVINHTEQCMRLCSDEEIMSMLSDVTSRTQAQIEECHGRVTDMEISEKADIIVEVDCAEALQQFCLENMWISDTIADMLEMVNIPQTTEVQKEVTFTVLNKSGKKISNREMICHGRCKVTETISSFKIINNSLNMFDIIYTPRDRGNYLFEVTAYGHTVPGSPFTLTASINPTELKKLPIQVWGDVTRPFIVEINSKGEIIVVEYNRAILIFNKEGIKIKTVDMTPHTGNALRSVTIDHEDNIYFIRDDIASIGKFDRNFDIVQQQDVQQVAGPGHCGIAVTGDEVLVTERNNKGQIVVYSRDLNFVRKISIIREVELFQLCLDRDRQLYVSNDDGTIIVLTMCGDILRTFSKIQYGVQLLEDPVWVYVFDHYVYVADYFTSRTVVFTTAGDYVAALNHYGLVCVDKTDGVVYCCDYFGDHVFIY